MRAGICPHTCIEFLKTVKRLTVNRLACGIACSDNLSDLSPCQTDSVATKEPQLGGVLKFSFELFKTETWFEICRQIEPHWHSGALEHEPPCAPAAHACTLFVSRQKSKVTIGTQGCTVAHPDPDNPIGLGNFHSVLFSHLFA